MMLQRLPLVKHQDNRGVLLQNEYPELAQHWRHFMVSYSEPGIIRGNHYHKHKKEWFLVLQGEMELHLMSLGTQVTDTYSITAEVPELVVIEPNVVHAFQNVSDTTLIFLGLVNEAFNSAEPDTYQYQILEAKDVI